MAMIKCPECEGNISDRAMTCPHCGFPLKESETEYTLQKGVAEGSGFGSFLRALAWIAWIGGLIVAITGAQVVEVSRYGSSTKFSFIAFLTAFLTYFIYGVLLMCMGTVVDNVAGTFSIVSALGLKKNKTEVKSNSVDRDVKHDTIPPVSEKKNSSTSVRGAGSSDDEKSSDTYRPTVSAKSIDPSWIDEGKGFARCPQCNCRMTHDFARARGKCPNCGHEYKANHVM